MHNDHTKSCHIKLIFSLRDILLLVTIFLDVVIIVMVMVLLEVFFKDIVVVFMTLVDELMYVGLFCNGDTS